MQEFSSGGVSAATEGEDQQNESGFLKWYSPFSQVLHHPPRKILVNQSTAEPTSLIAQSSQEDKAALSFLFSIWSYNTEKLLFVNNNAVTKSETDLFWAVLPWCTYLNVLGYFQDLLLDLW